EQAKERDQQKGKTAGDRDFRPQNDPPASPGDLGKLLDPGFDVRNLVGWIVFGHKSCQESGLGGLRGASLPYLLVAKTRITIADAVYAPRKRSLKSRGRSITGIPVGSTSYRVDIRRLLF